MNGLIYVFRYFMSETFTITIQEKRNVRLRFSIFQHKPKNGKKKIKIF